MIIILKILIFIIGLYSIAVFINSRIERCSLEYSLKHINQFLLQELLYNKEYRGYNFTDLTQKIWSILKVVDEEVYNKIDELAKTGTSVCEVKYKDDSVVELRFLFPCQACEKAEAEAMIIEIIKNFNLLLLDCGWIPMMNRLEGIYILVDTSCGNSKLAQNLLLNRRNRLIASLEPPEDDYDDEL